MDVLLLQYFPINPELILYTELKLHLIFQWGSLKIEITIYKYITMNTYCTHILHYNQCSVLMHGIEIQFDEYVVGNIWHNTQKMF